MVTADQLVMSAVLAGVSGRASSREQLVTWICGNIIELLDSGWVKVSSYDEIMIVINYHRLEAHLDTGRVPILFADRSRFRVSDLAQVEAQCQDFYFEPGGG